MSAAAGFAEIAVDVAPAPGPAERDAAAAIAIGETFGRDDTKARRIVMTALRLDQRRHAAERPARGSGFAVFAAAAFDADVQGHRGVDGGRMRRLFERSVRCRLVHSKARRWMSRRTTAATQTCGERTCTPFGQPLTPGRPARNGEYGRRRQVSWLAGHRRHRLPGPAAQWHQVQAFRSQLRGQLRLRCKPGNFPVRSARYSLLVRSEDQTPSAMGIASDGNAAESIPSRRTMPAGCRNGAAVDPVAGHGMNRRTR